MKKFLAIVALILIPQITFADFSQLDSSTRSDYNTVGGTTYNYIVQGFGTGLTGDIGTLSFYLNVNATSTNQIAVTILGCDDMACSGGANVFTNYPDIQSTEFTGIKTLYQLDPTTSTSFNPSYYYFLYVQPSGGSGNNGYSYGSNSNSYAGGAANCSDTRCGSVLDYYFEVSNTTTGSRFITVTPVASSTVATTTTMGASWFINSDDYTDDMVLNIYFLSNTAVYIGQGGYVPDPIQIPILSSGYGSTSTTTTFLAPGGTEARYTIEDPSYLTSIPIIGVLFSGQTIVATSSYFYVGYRTQADDVAETVGNVLDSLSGTATSSCTNFTTDFVSDCVKFLFIPNGESLTTSIEALRNGVLATWPVGYVTRIIEILNASSSAQLPVFYAKVPNGVVGAGAEITLDLNNSLDFILNATTSRFANISASSTKTFYEYTRVYWETIIYILLGLYILRRILGSHIIPKGINEYGGVGDKPYGPNKPNL